MKKSYQVIENKQFIGRAREKRNITSFLSSEEPGILIVYGRRRVGKTELIEQSCIGKFLIKLEGLENEPQSVQIKHIQFQLSQYFELSYLTKLNILNWVELFELIADLLQEQTAVLYLEELQWMANYEHHLISALKYVWDNRFRHQRQLKLVLCGSAPSFMINQVVQSKALYNRSTHELRLQEFSLQETQTFLQNRSLREVMTAYLTIGGIPEYLKQLQSSNSILIGICEKSFRENSFFSNEYQRIFISSLSGNPHYKSIIDFLSHRRFATRVEISSALQITGGGSLTKVLNDLELCGFIERIVPYHSPENSKNARFCIRDAYLTFYFKFIKPISKEISDGLYQESPLSGLNMDTYWKWLGYAFERMVRRQHHLIAKILGFSGIRYKSGAYYRRRSSNNDEGLQIDLLFDRADHVITLCEIKYVSEKVDISIIAEIERKIKLLPQQKHLTLQKVLITTEGITQGLLERHYFDRVILVDELFTA